MHWTRALVYELVENWIKEGILREKTERKAIFREEYQDLRYCIMHRTRSHGTVDCFVIRHMFAQKLEEGKVLPPITEEGRDEGIGNFSLIIIWEQSCNHFK